MEPTPLMALMAPMDPTALTQPRQMEPTPPTEPMELMEPTAQPILLSHQTPPILPTLLLASL